MSFPNNRYGLDLLKLDSFMMLVLQISNWKMTLVMYQAVTKCWGRWEPFLLQSAPWRCRLICWEHQRFSGSMTNLMRTYLRYSQLGLLSQGTWGACQDNEFFGNKTFLSQYVCFFSSSLPLRIFLVFSFIIPMFPLFFACPRILLRCCATLIPSLCCFFPRQYEACRKYLEVGKRVFWMQSFTHGMRFFPQNVYIHSLYNFNVCPEKWWLGIPIFRGELEL